MALGRKPIEIVNDGKHQLLVKADHWERIYLNKVAKVQNGYAFSSTNFSKSEGLPLIRIRDIDSDTTVDKYNGEFPQEYLVNKGDILVGMDGDFKAAKWKGEQALLNQRVCRIFPNSKDFDEKFLFLCLQPFLDAIHAETSAVTVKHLSSKTIEEIPLPYPPLEEQQQIVSKIEELFSELDKGIEELKTAQQQLKVYRQAVLKWAFEGKLTSNGVMDGQLPEGWRWIELNQIAKIVSGYAFKSTDFKDQGVPVIKISNIGYSEFVWKDQEFLPESYLELHKNFAIQSDDLLIALTRPITNNTTKVCKYPKNATAGLLNQRVASVKTVNGDKEYLFWYFQTDSFKKYIRSKFSETLQPNLSPKDLAQAPIPFCSIEEQQQIVQEIESRLSVCDKIEETINKSLRQAEALRQSILKKAFEGSLGTKQSFENEYSPKKQE